MEAPTLTRVTRNGQITLPAMVRRTLRVEEGDYIEVRVAGESIILTPKKLVDASQAYFWTPDWQEGEREGSADIAAGRTYEAADVDDLIAQLERARRKGQ